MAFTIEVKKKREDEEFGFVNLEMFHQDCGGGKLLRGSMMGRFYTGYINQPFMEFYELTCTRCEKRFWIIKQSQAPLDIIKTAIDGQQRKVEGYQGTLIPTSLHTNGIDGKLYGSEITGIDDPKNVKVNIVVIQKS